MEQKDFDKIAADTYNAVKDCGIEEIKTQIINLDNEIKELKARRLGYLLAELQHLQR